VCGDRNGCDAGGGVLLGAVPAVSWCGGGSFEEKSDFFESKRST